MVIARTPVELAQIRKLLFAVRTSDYDQIQRLSDKGIKGLVNYNEPSTGETPLLVAVQNNDERMVEYLLALGAHPNGLDFQGRTPLIRAAEQGFVEGVRILLKVNSDTTIRDMNGNNVLFACLTDGTYRQEQCFLAIVSQGSFDANCISGNGKPLLIAACEKGISAEKISSVIIERGADVNAVDQETGCTALHAACNSGSVKIVRQLLQRGANSNARDKNEHTPAHAAVKSNIFQLLPILSAYAGQFNLVDRWLNSPVHLAAMLNQGKSIKFMVQRGGSTKQKNHNKQSPLKIAVTRKNKQARKAIRFVEKKNYNQPIVASSKSTLQRHFELQFYDWLQENSNQVLRRCHQLENPENHRIRPTELKSIVNELGFNRSSDEELENIIRQHETNPNEIDYGLLITGKLFVSKDCLLSGFLSSGKLKKKKVKLQTKSQPNIPIATQNEGPRMPKGNPPKVYVKQHQFITDTNRFSRDHVPRHPFEDDSSYYLDANQPEFVHIHNAAHRGDLQTLRDAFKSGVSVDIQDQFYKTLLMVAAANGDTETTEFLLQSGANIHLEDNFKWTALHHAVTSGELRVVELLVKAGAKVNHESLTWGTPLSRAIEISSPEIIQYLIDHRANIHHENIIQRNLVDLATDFASPQVLKMIREAYERKASKKGSKKPKKRAPPINKSKLQSETESALTEIKPVQFQPIILRRGSLLFQEKHRIGSKNQLRPNAVRLQSEWIKQATTAELLEKKAQLRTLLTKDIDFPSSKRPLVENAQLKLDDSATSKAQMKTSRQRKIKIK